MKWFLLMLFFSMPALAQIECAVHWKTLTEELPPQEVKLDKAEKTLKVSENLTLTLKKEKKGISLVVVEPIKSNPDSSVTYTFGCDKNLNCKGSQKINLEGKVTNKKMAVSPSGYFIQASIDGRDFFTYVNKPKKSFEYNYIAYYAENRQPLGLKVDCHE